MSGDVRLDAATLEHVAKWLDDEAERDRTFAERSLQPSVALTTAGVRERTARRLRELAVGARSRPPALSDWVAACEGTGLGAMTMGESDDGWALFWGGDSFGAGLDGTFVSLAYDRDSGKVAAVIGFTPIIYRTPTELRAALEALARKSGAPS